MLDKVAPTLATPLSFAQQRLWVLDRLHPNCAQNISTGIRLTGSLDIDALEKALSEVSTRHEILRSAFRMEGGEPKQLVLPSSGIPLKVVDLSGNPQSQREINAARSSREESERPFDLGEGPLVRALLVRLASTEFILLITAHHIVCDQRSAEILLDEVAVFYDAVIRGESFPPPNRPNTATSPPGNATLCVGAWRRNWPAARSFCLEQLLVWICQPIDHGPLSSLFVVQAAKW